MDPNGVIEISDFAPVTTADAGTPPPSAVKRFEFSLEPKQFFINDDLFLAAPALPLGIAGQLAAFKGALEAEAVDKLLDFFDLILLDASAQLFRERAFSKDKPIPMTQVMPIINWLLEEYGMRPTQPSADSSSTSADAGGSTPSTDGASPAASTGPDSLSLDS